MSAFAGIIALNGSSIGRGAEDPTATRLTPLRRGRPVPRRIENAIFFYRASPPTDRDGEQPLTDADGRVLFAALARLDNREELGGALGLSGAELAQTSDAALIRRIYERWGDTGVARCLGAFAFAHWDAAGRRLTLGRGCLCNRPLFYHLGPELVCFATTLGALLAMPGVPRAIDELALG